MQSAGGEGEKDVHRLFTQPVLTSHRSILMLEIAIVAQLVAKDKAKGNYCACFVERALPVIPANLHVRFLVPSHEHHLSSRTWPHLAAPGLLHGLVISTADCLTTLLPYSPCALSRPNFIAAR